MKPSGEAPACPEQQERPSVHDQNQQVEPEQEAVQLQAQFQPVGLGQGLGLVLLQGQAQGGQLLQEPVQARGSFLLLVQGQQVLLQGRLQLIVWEESGTFKRLSETKLKRTTMCGRCRRLTLRRVDRVQSPGGGQRAGRDLPPSRAIPVQQASRQRHLLHLFVVVMQQLHHQHGLYEAEHQQSHAHHEEHACV